jgi:hypothetical protein
LIQKEADEVEDEFENTVSRVAKLNPAQILGLEKLCPIKWKQFPHPIQCIRIGSSQPNALGHLSVI